MKTESPDNAETSDLEIPSDITAASGTTLRECVKRSLDTYFNQVDGEPVSDLYQMVLKEVEIPLLEAVMKNTRSNQTRASLILGLNRGTLRKKLKQYNIL